MPSWAIPSCPTSTTSSSAGKQHVVLNDLYHSLSPIAFQIGPFAVRWYGLAYLVGFLFAGVIFARVTKRWNLSLTIDDVMTAMTTIAFGTILGGRLGYVLVYGAGYYWEHPLEILAINQGGMSFHGGFVGVIVLGLIVCHRYGYDFHTMADLGCIAMPLGIALGRCANFVNGELWGKPTDLPWGVVFETGGNIARHPSQLYEALLEGVVLLIIMLILVRRMPPLPQGTFLGTFLLLYGVFRFLIEFVRVPDAQLGYLADWLTMGQVLSTPFIILGVVELALAFKLNRPQRVYIDD
ncbi:MAG: prolipoprotein diacylglyceryl transferase [Atopobiaceae bacterium]|nr:prolipoprotein diacylglyceryl transferase [Atopobiaceae bacterium]